MKHQAVLLASVLALAFSPSALAQSFKKVNVKDGIKIAQVASGGASVWALAVNGQPYVLKGKTLVPANTIQLSQIAVGGGSVRQPDSVWALDSSGNIYNATKSGTSWVFTQVPGVLSFIAVGPGYYDKCHPYEVWGLNPSSQIYHYNFCINNWDYVPGTLCSLSVAGGKVWGTNCNGEIFWYDTHAGFQQIPGTLEQVAVGPGGVWGVRQRTLCRFDPFHGVFGDLPYSADQVQAGGDGAWSMSGPDTQFLSGDGYAIFYTNFVSYSVGSGAGVWGVNPSGQVYAFSTP